MKTSKNIYRIFLALILGGIGSLLSAEAESPLDGYLQAAAEKNPGLKASFKDYLSSLEQVPQMGALPDPTVTFGYFILPVETRFGPQQSKIGLSQMFPWFGTLKAQENTAIQNAKAKYEAFNDQKSKLFYDLRTAYYDLYFMDKSIQTTRNNLDLLSSLREMALIKIQSGKASAADELRVEMEILELEDQLAYLMDMRNARKVAFCNLMNVDAREEVILPENLPTTDLTLRKEALLDSIQQNNHQVLSLEFKEAAMSFKQEAASKMGKPSFTIGLDYTFIGPSDNDMLLPGQSGKDAFMFPMIGIKVPLYRKKYAAMVKEAVYLKEAVQDMKLDKQNMLHTVFEKAYADYQKAKRNIVLHSKELDLAGRTLKILESQYSVDGRNFEDLLMMERKILKYGLELKRSETDLNASKAFIYYLMGN